jgi:hypothetical protein
MQPDRTVAIFTAKLGCLIAHRVGYFIDSGDTE